MYLLQHRRARRDILFLAVPFLPPYTAIKYYYESCNSVAVVRHGDNVNVERPFWIPFSVDAFAGSARLPPPEVYPMLRGSWHPGLPSRDGHIIPVEISVFTINNIAHVHYFTRRSNKAYQRHIMLLSSKPLRESIPDEKPYGMTKKLD